MTHYTHYQQAKGGDPMSSEIFRASRMSVQVSLELELPLILM